MEVKSLADQECSLPNVESYSPFVAKISFWEFEPDKKSLKEAGKFNMARDPYYNTIRSIVQCDPRSSAHQELASHRRK